MTKAEILTSINYIDRFLNIPALNGSIPVTVNGRLLLYTGGFNMVFKLKQNDKYWALRVWYKSTPYSMERYQKVSQFLNSIGMPYFDNFVYDENSLLVGNSTVDTTRMEWVEGTLFKDYLKQNLNNPQALRQLGANFLKMCKDLRENQISHGDLQEGNIIIDEKNCIKLIDYDSVCIPELEGEQEFVTGKEGYQHFSRIKGIFGNRLSLQSDYFSELIIYLSIIALSEKPELWKKIDGTEHMLFSPHDLEDIENAPIFKELVGLSPQTDQLVEILKLYLKTEDYRQLQPFDTFFNLPVISHFEPAQKFILQNYPIEIEWCVENAIKVYISPEVGTVNSEGKISFIPQTDTYTLTAEGLTEKVTSTLKIAVFPIPMVKSLMVPAPITEIVLDLDISMPKFPHLSTEINYVHSNHEVPFRNDLHVTFPNFNLKRFEKVELNVERPDFNVEILCKTLKNKLKNLTKKVFEKIKLA